MHAVALDRPLRKGQLLSTRRKAFTQPGGVCVLVKRMSKPTNAVALV